MNRKSWKTYLVVVLTCMMLIMPQTATLSGSQIIWQEAAAQAADSSIGYYGNQLSDASLDIYKALVAHIDELMTVSEIEVTFTEPVAVNDYSAMIVQRAWDAFVYDYPEVFWLDISGTTNQALGYGKHFYTTVLYLQNAQEGSNCYNSYYRDHPEEVLSDQRAMLAQAQKIAAQAAKLDTRYAQVVFLHDWLAANNIYNDEAAADLRRYPLTHQAVSALVNGKEGGPVCDGYSKAFQILCKMLDIPCVCISGTGISGNAIDSHMWNAVQMEDGKWYGVDVTWDDTDSRGGRGAADTFLLVGTETVINDKMTFGQGHLPDGSFSPGGHKFSFPELSRTAYETSKRSAAGTALTANELTETQAALVQSGCTLVGTPVKATLLRRDTLMTTIRVNFGQVSPEPTVIVRVDGSSVQPVLAHWVMQDGNLIAIIQLTESSILAPVQTEKRTFTDVAEDAWYYQVVNEGVQRLWMTGTGHGEFSPDGWLTGAQMRAILLRILGVPEENIGLNQPWYAGSEAAAANLNFTGVGATSETVQTRADAAIAITHTLTLLEKEQTLSPAEADAILADYTDTAQAGDDTRYALAMLVKNDLMQGVSPTELAPDAKLTRAQMAALCSRIADFLAEPTV